MNKENLSIHTPPQPEYGGGNGHDGPSDLRERLIKLETMISVSMATKTDISNLELSIEKKVSSLLKWIGGVVITLLVGIIIALAKFLPARL